MNERDPFDSDFDRIDEMIRRMMGGETNLSTRPSDARNEEDEPKIDVLDYGDKVKVVAETPEVIREDVRVEVDGSTVDIIARGEKDSFRERVKIPSDVDEEDYKTTFSNRVLEVTLEKRV